MSSDVITTLPLVTHNLGPVFIHQIWRLWLDLEMTQTHLPQHSAHVVLWPGHEQLPPSLHRQFLLVHSNPIRVIGGHWPWELLRTGRLRENHVTDPKDALCGIDFLQEISTRMYLVIIGTFSTAGLGILQHRNSICRLLLWLVNLAL